MIKILIQIITLGVIFAGCSAPNIEPAKLEKITTKIDYLKDVKPILDKRCVVCHSCYNAPCQAKYSSFEGIDRGGSKIKVYDALRLRAIDPTRLFTDARDTKEWRKKGFFTLREALDTNRSYDDSILMHMINQKKLNPQIVGIYDAEKNEEWKCPSNKKEVNEYFQERPNHAMPFGLPSLTDAEFITLSSWIHNGSNGPSEEEEKILKTPSKEAQVEIKKWEDFLNKNDAKHKMTARYLYEHLYLAHLHFQTPEQEFYELVRSYTPAPYPIQNIATLRPFDDPNVNVFFYRFRKIHSTIVHKTHMVYEIGDEKLARFNELFIKPKWDEKPHIMDYDVKISANPFLNYAQIPVRSRYQFLLDNSHYTVMTFIRGPVCRGQMALNVIHDHFWVMFKDPDSDITVLDPKFLYSQAENLALPIEKVEGSLLEVFSDAYRDRYAKYYKEKEEYINKRFPNGQGIESIWKGNKASDAPLLTVYRHFNSASVHKGVLGEEPRTMWVIDYPQLERIYYTLVAGYDIYGNITHQTNLRRYMDFLRLEGEGNFLAYMPKEERLPMLKSWYIGDSDIQNKKSMRIEGRSTKIKYKTKEYKSEFIAQVVNEHILKETAIHFDDINYVPIGKIIPKMPTKFETEEDFKNGFRASTVKGTGFIKHITDSGANNLFMRLKLSNGKYMPIFLVVNRWHDNVNSLFNKYDSTKSDKDTIDFLYVNAGSYPNMFVDVDYTQLPDFFDLINNYEDSDKYNAKIEKYFISRSDEKFWTTYDWFQDYLNKYDPLKTGLYDLNRYFRKAW